MAHKGIDKRTIRRSGELDDLSRIPAAKQLGTPTMPVRPEWEIGRANPRARCLRLFESDA
jgi:hypothetical protein